MILLLEISVFNKVLASTGREGSYEDLRITNKSEIASCVILCLILHFPNLFRIEPTSVFILFVKFSSNSSSLELQFLSQAHHYLHKKNQMYLKYFLILPYLSNHLKYFLHHITCPDDSINEINKFNLKNIGEWTESR